MSALRAPELFADPNALARHYSRFDVANRLLLTGHSHQAWPDCGFVGQQQAWADAATLVDQKWEAAEREAERVRQGFARLLGDTSGDIALGPNTHELVVRFLSALPLRERPRLISTDGEFHSLRRQLDRLAEEGIDVVRVASAPAAEIAERVIAALDTRTAAVLVSSVLFGSAQIVPNLGDVMAACERNGALLLVDAYHALNVVPFALGDLGLARAYVTGGGYKYCQLGEGNCFLRLPPDCRLRPVITGWFAEFGELETGPTPGSVKYAAGAARFAGATYDPTSHYRAAEVFEFFRAKALEPHLLREVSQHQVGLLAEDFDKLDANPALIRRDVDVPLTEIGGFLALYTPHAQRLTEFLAEAGVRADYREETLRLGPAPYLSDRQLRDAVRALEGALGRL